VEKAEAVTGYADFSTSLGFSIGSPRYDNSEHPRAVGNVWWNSPAFKAGVTPDMELVAVNGTAYTWQFYGRPFSQRSTMTSRSQ
jgi:predicted metalloprotease with PDZ domain